MLLKVESMATMPRILAEISRVEDQLKSIESEMAILSDQLSSLDQRNVAGVEDLSRLVKAESFSSWISILTQEVLTSDNIS